MMGITATIIQELLHPAHHRRRPQVRLQVSHSIPGNEKMVTQLKFTVLRPGCTLRGG